LSAHRSTDRSRSIYRGDRLRVPRVSTLRDHLLESEVVISKLLKKVPSLLRVRVLQRKLKRGAKDGRRSFLIFDS
jgi:hypothetical protein